MKTPLSRRIMFISKSLLWSVMLYAICMLALNWDDVSNSSKMNKTMPVVQMPAFNPCEPVADSKPVISLPDSSITGITHAITAAGNVFTQLFKVAVIFRK